MEMKEVWIAGANEEGLTLALDQHRHWLEPWDAIDSVLIARVLWGDTTALAAAVMLRGGERTIVLTEVHPEWTLFMAAAQIALPGFIEQSFWEPGVSQAKKGLMIYQRPPVPRQTVH